MLIVAQVVDPNKEAQDLAKKLGFDQPVVHAVNVEPDAYFHGVLDSRWSKRKSLFFGGSVLAVLLAVTIPAVFVALRD